MDRVYVPKREAIRCTFLDDKRGAIWKKGSRCNAGVDFRTYGATWRIHACVISALHHTGVELASREQPPGERQPSVPVDNLFFLFFSFFFFFFSQIAGKQAGKKHCLAVILVWRRQPMAFFSLLVFFHNDHLQLLPNWQFLWNKNC